MGQREDVSYSFPENRWVDDNADSCRPDTEVVTVEIGLGICLDMPVLEATSFTRTKIASLQK